MTLVIEAGKNLKPFNTLALPAQAAFFVAVSSPDDIAEAMTFVAEHKLPYLVIGQGSNIVLADDFPGLVLHMQLRGITADSDGDAIVLDVAAGEIWHDLVRYTLAQGWYGLENLALIPGTVGAAPIQNVGAYGLEVAQRIISVTGWNSVERCWQTLGNDECRFGYRDSIFKQALKDQFIITSVRFGLSKIPQPVLHYPPLSELFAGCEKPEPAAIADAVERIRREKLPDPSQLPNAGSFFKNPQISPLQYQQLKNRFPDLPGYPQADKVKLPAAWLIDRAGWKGFRETHAGVHTSQALVLVNHGAATGADILALAKRIRDDILHRYDIELEIEPQVLP